MKNFKSGNDKRGGFGRDRGGRDDRSQRGGDKPTFYGKSRGGDRSTDREVRMFKAVCSDCKKSCDVPFKPSSDKPVFCRDCFSAKRDRETREYKAGLTSGEPKKFGQDKPVTHVAHAHQVHALPKVDESMKKQLDEMSARIDTLTILVENMMTEKKTDSSPAPVAVKSAKVTSVKVIAPAKNAVKKVTAKKVAPQAVQVKKVLAKKTVAKKVAAKKTK